MTHQDLIQEILNELLLQRPARQQPMQIRTKELRYKVNVLEWGDEDVGEGDDVLVLDVLEEFEFAIGALSEDGSRKGFHDLLDGDGGACELIFGRTVEFRRVWKDTRAWSEKSEN